MGMSEQELGKTGLGLFESMRFEGGLKADKVNQQPYTEKLT